MTFDSFWRLYSILSPHILSSLAEGSKYVCKGGRAGGNYSLPPIRNGPIPHSIRLGASLRYFAGGSPYDIMYIFGISYSEVLTSMWTVVDAVHRCPKFDISYPDTVEEQRKIAAGFEAASTPYNFLRAQRRQFGVDELPRTTLFNMIVDGHWRRPIRNMRR